MSVGGDGGVSCRRLFCFLSAVSSSWWSLVILGEEVFHVKGRRTSVNGS